MKSIAVATTGGDAPGMNAALRAVVRKAVSENLKVIGFERGYAGLLANEYRPLDARSVGGIIHIGGTFLKTSRAEEMKTKEGVLRAAGILKESSVDGLVIIGGNGSFRAASELHEASGVPIVGIPATIDNDLAGTDTTIGFDTAVNTALEAPDKIRDTATSHERVFVVEVMGRDRGFIALEVAVGAGAEIVLIPEMRYDVGTVCDTLKEGHRKGKRSAIIIMAEGAGDCMDVTEAIGKHTGSEVRLTRLGYIQRGSPHSLQSHSSLQDGCCKCTIPSGWKEKRDDRNPRRSYDSSRPQICLHNLETNRRTPVQTCPDAIHLELLSDISDAKYANLDNVTFL